MDRWVVNWFQIVFLREDSQVKQRGAIGLFSCELISNCIFTWGFTRVKSLTPIIWPLWIDFKLYFYVRIHKLDSLESCWCCVVNWFQIVFLREDSQVLIKKMLWRFCCELISNCIFTWGFTSKHKVEDTELLLWIDFKLYFYVRIHKLEACFRLLWWVVNWFQIVFLREDSQDGSESSPLHWCCELISNCIFTWGFTSV